MRLIFCVNKSSAGCEWMLVFFHLFSAYTASDVWWVIFWTACMSYVITLLCECCYQQIIDHIVNEIYVVSTRPWTDHSMRHLSFALSIYSHLILSHTSHYTVVRIYILPISGTLVSYDIYIQAWVSNHAEEGLLTLQTYRLCRFDSLKIHKRYLKAPIL